MSTKTDKIELREIKKLGVTDGVNTCEKCGKSHLKKTVAIEFNGYDVRYYGTTCAARVLGITTARNESPQDFVSRVDRMHQSELNLEAAKKNAQYLANRSGAQMAVIRFAPNGPKPKPAQYGAQMAEHYFKKCDAAPHLNYGSAVAFIDPV